MPRHGASSSSGTERWCRLPKHRERDILQLYEASKNELGCGTRERRRKFCDILGVYYPWFSQVEMARAYSCVAPQERKRDATLLADRLRAKYSARVLSLFGRVDADGNGTVSLAEFREAFDGVLGSGGDASSHFRAADANGDGQLDIGEFFTFVARTPRVLLNFDEAVASAQCRADAAASARRALIFLPTHRGDERPALCHVKPLDELVRAHRSYLPPTR